MFPPKITREKKKLTTKNPAKQVERCSARFLFKRPAHFSKTVPHSWPRIHALELLKKFNFVFMHLEFFKRFNLVFKPQFENEKKTTE